MIVTLTTDFGHRDGYVAAVKGVLLSLAPAIRIVDVTHEIEPGDVFGAAFVLLEVAHFFPKGSVHVVVVDPGVGSAREPIALTARGQIFVGPNNGVLSLAAPAPDEIREITHERFMRREVSATFHGRDVFAPTAAELVRGTALYLTGPTLAAERYVKIEVPLANSSGETPAGEVIHVDRFGNAITNLREDCLSLRVGTCDIPVRRTYAEVGPGELVAYRGSSGWLEIGVRDGSASGRLGLERGTAILVQKHP